MGPLGLFRASWRRRGGVAAAHIYALVIAPICDVIEFCFDGADGQRGLSRAATWSASPPRRRAAQLIPWAMILTVVDAVSVDGGRLGFPARAPSLWDVSDAQSGRRGAREVGLNI